jgi:cell division protein FtsB
MNPRGITFRQILMLLGLLVLVFLIMDFNNRMTELHRLSEQEEQVAVQATQIVQTKVYLETQIAYATSDKAVEEWARVQGHMIQPGDRPIVPLASEGGQVVATPTPVVGPVYVSNWQVWLALFFDDVPVTNQQ